MYSNTNLAMDSSAEQSGVDASAKKQSWLLWPVKGFVLIAAVLTALFLNALAFFS